MLSSKGGHKMDNNKIITDGLRTLLLAGVGAAALTVDKSQEILKEASAEKKAQEPKKDFADMISGLSADDLAALKEAILKAETKE